MKKPFTITHSDGYRLFADIKADIIPFIGELINQLILAGKSEEEVCAAVRTAVRSYMALAREFMGRED